MFSKYILQFTKNVSDKQTHLSFNKGKYNVPDEKYDEFYKNYYKTIINEDDSERLSLYLIEKVYNSNFAYFLDLDIKNRDVDDDDILDVIEVVQAIISKMFKKDKDVNLCEYIVSKRITDTGSNYHINFYNLIVNNVIGKKLTLKILENKSLLSGEIKSCIDISVYRTGLRLLGSRKDIKNKIDYTNDIYRIYNLENQEFIELKDTTYEQFLKTVVKRRLTIQITQVIEDKTVKNVNEEEMNKKQNIPVKGINNDKIVFELTKLLNTLKMTNEILQDFDVSIQRIYASQNKTGLFCYYVSINGKYCPFKKREHSRPASPIYFEISTSGIYLKCYDEECLRRRFPENGLSLPENFETEYSQIYLSMTTKYWHSDITITDEIRHYLESSLSGSHYSIAKAVFSIYKDRFRVDDIKNTEWYEFDSIRWKRSHLMNILISEDLPKYYRAIKISDTSVQTKDLQDFLVNNDRIDANLRNQMVDNIISKLENVSFKNNIISQIIYLFKTHDQEFYSNLDSKTYLIGFKNGVYDLREREFRKGLQEDCITFSTKYDWIDYDESSQQVQDIYKFLGQIIPNKRVLEYTLKVLGKALVGIPEERFYIWTGLSGANGKSTLVNFLENTLGDYITSVDVSLLTNKRGNASNASPDVVRLRGKRIFTFQEPEHDDKLRTGILKQYTGGDTIIARELFKAPVSFKLQGTMIMCCNDLPAVSSIDGGTWRRIRVVEFKSRFCDNPVKENEFKIDPTIKTKINEWRPYFMSILINWYYKFLEQGMNEPDEVKQATAKYKVDNDKFNEFFDAVLEEHSDSFETNKNIYSNFSSWWSNNYPNSKVPELRDLRRAMKIKYGNEKETLVHGTINYGFNIKLKQVLIDDDVYSDV
jgi:P4 family phage/plasmid primase-like protien|uniref:SF3 helicase domain-containing protein n=1 Tax=viral metagenome TaxID=1070528 RepID=A0A6C0AM57_9ZZZZ